MPFRVCVAHLDRSRDQPYNRMTGMPEEESWEVASVLMGSADDGALP